MKKLLLDLDALAVESFDVAEPLATVRGTVKGAGNAAATLLLSQCNSGCMQSGIQHCFATQTCC